MANSLSKKLNREFFLRDVLKVAPDLIGKILVVRGIEGGVNRFVITETEAYRGDGDKACHASKGKTKRTEVMFREGGLVYVYLIYGMYWMLNFVTENEEVPQAVLIRGVQGISGPGRLGRKLKLDKSFYGEDLATSDRIWLEDSAPVSYTSTPRIGIDYAGEPWVSKQWRFVRL